MKGCLLAPFKLVGIIFRLFKFGIVWCLENGIKGFVAAGVFILIIGLVLGQCNRGGNTAMDMPKTGINIPTKVEAPYSVTSGTEAYFTEKCHWQGSILIIENYWYLKDGVWVSSEGRARTLSDKPKVVKR